MFTAVCIDCEVSELASYGKTKPACFACGKPMRYSRCECTLTECDCEPTQQTYGLTHTRYS